MNNITISNTTNNCYTYYRNIILPELYHYLQKIMKWSKTLPVSTDSVEWGFSCMHRVISYVLFDRPDTQIKSSLVKRVIPINIKYILWFSNGLYCCAIIAILSHQISQDFRSSGRFFSTYLLNPKKHIFYILRQSIFFEVFYRKHQPNISKIGRVITLAKLLLKILLFWTKIRKMLISVILRNSANFWDIWPVLCVKYLGKYAHSEYI